MSHIERAIPPAVCQNNNVPLADDTLLRGELPAMQPSYPPSIVAELARQTLVTLPADIIDTVEEISLLLGSHRRSRDDKLIRARLLLTQLIHEGIAPDYVPHSILNTDIDPLDLGGLANKIPNSGIRALTLMRCLLTQSMPKALQQSCEEHLNQIIQKDDWVVELFTHSDTHPLSTMHLARLKAWCQQVCCWRPALTDWFDLLQTLSDRQATLQALIRSLAFYVSLQAQPIQKGHLAAVIHDLRRLNLLLGLETFCRDIASRVGESTVSGDGVWRCFLSLLEASHPTVYWVIERLPQFDGRLSLERRFVYCLEEMVRLLPAPYFFDTEQQQSLQHALVSYLQMLDDRAQWLTEH